MNTNYVTLGISTYHSIQSSGIEFECKILGAPPTKGYLEEILPKKLKIWLGLI